MKQFLSITLMILFVSIASIAQQYQPIIYTTSPGQQFDQYKMMNNQNVAPQQSIAEVQRSVQEYMLAQVDENMHRIFGNDYSKAVEKSQNPVSAAKYGKYMYSIGLPGRSGVIEWTSIPLTPDDMIRVYDGKPFAIQTQVTLGDKGPVSIWAPLYLDEDNAVKVKDFNKKRAQNLRQQMFAANPQLAIEHERGTGQGLMIGASLLMNIGLPILDRVLYNNQMRAVARTQGSVGQPFYTNTGGVHIGNGVVVSTGGVQYAW